MSSRGRRDIHQAAAGSRRPRTTAKPRWAASGLPPTSGCGRRGVALHRWQRFSGPIDASRNEGSRDRAKEPILGWIGLHRVVFQSVRAAEGRIVHRNDVRFRHVEIAALRHRAEGTFNKTHRFYESPHSSVARSPNFGVMLRRRCGQASKRAVLRNRLCRRGQIVEDGETQARLRRRRPTGHPVPTG